MMADLAYGTTPDAIDHLIALLNQEMGDDLTFERDVLDVDRPEDWGAVELTNVVNEYADGHIVDQVYIVDIWAGVSDRESGWLERIEGVLKSYGGHLGYWLKERAYLHDLQKVMWHWECQLWSLEAPEESAAAGDDAGSGETAGGDASGIPSGDAEAGGASPEGISGSQTGDAEAGGASPEGTSGSPAADGENQTGEDGNQAADSGAEGGGS
jgi:hypothetical protein